MAWNSLIDDIHTFSLEVVVKTIYHQRFEEGGKNVVYNLEYAITGTDTDGSGNSFLLEREMLAFNPSQVDPDENSFIEIDEVTDDIAKNWILEHFEGSDNYNVAFTNLIYGPPDPSDPVEPTDPV